MAQITFEEAQKIVEKQKAYKIEYWSGSELTYMNPNPDQDEWENKDTPDLILGEDLVEDDSTRYEGGTMCVTENSVWWNDTIEHTSAEIYTDSIVIEELDHNFLMATMPFEDLPTQINQDLFKSSEKIVKERLSNGH